MAPPAPVTSDDDLGADLRRFGLLAYELLVGQPPVAADASSSESNADDHPAPPSPRELRPELPEAAEQVLLRQISSEPDQRFPAAGEFLAALRAGLDTRLARPEPSVTRALATPRQPDPWTALQHELQEAHRSRQEQQRPARTRVRRRAFLAAAGALIVGGGAVAGLSVWSRLRSQWSQATGAEAEPPGSAVPPAGAPAGRHESSSGGSVSGAWSPAPGALF
jgi:serine/threonine-protein kinase